MGRNSSSHAMNLTDQEMKERASEFLDEGGSPVADAFTEKGIAIPTLL